MSFTLSRLFQRFRRRKLSTPAEGGVWVRITNVVATATLKQAIDLDAVVSAYPFAEYRPERFPGVALKPPRLKSTILLFHTGKLVCTGAISIDQARKAVHSVVQQLLAHRIITRREVSITIQNVVATGSVGGKVDLEKAAFLFERTLYEPEQFPGLIYRMEDPQVVMLIYASGRIVCVGAKREEAIQDAVQRLIRQLVQHSVIHFHS